MKLNDIDINSDTTDFENFMSVYKDKFDNYRLNLNETLYLQFDDNNLLTHETKTDTHWSLISYELYGTIKLAWVLMKVNNVKPKDTFSVISSATKIKYPSKRHISEILQYISKQ